MSPEPKTIALVLYPGLAALDFVGPLQVLTTLEQFAPDYRVVVVAANKEPVGSDLPMQMIAEPPLTRCRAPKRWSYPAAGSRRSAR